MGIARRGLATAMKPKASPADALRAVPPHDFVGARNALAAQLAKDGKAAEARQVAGLRRPSPVAWALNRASAARSRELGALVDAVDRLRRAQLGGGDLRAAMERYRSAFEPLVRGANQALQEAGVTVSAALDRRIRSTLLAAVTDRGLRADLEAARLADEHAEPGFAVLSGGPVPAGFLLDRPRKKHSPGPAKPAPAKPGPAKPASAGDPGETRRLAREQARAARLAAREEQRATRVARSLARQADRAERAAQAAERRVAAMRRALAALERRSGELRAAAEEARKARITPRAAPSAHRVPTRADRR
jgi:hypothetical protein